MAAIGADDSPSAEEVFNQADAARKSAAAALKKAGKSSLAQRAKVGATALALYEESCRLGHVAACLELGFVYSGAAAASEDMGAGADPKRSLAYYTEACGLGHGRACFFVGSSHHQAGDMEQAVDYYRVSYAIVGRLEWLASMSAEC